jgi:N-acetylglutamate synthase-like GNAT family acetyltransferase
MNSASELIALRQATEADLPAIQRVIAAAYDKYLSRMDKPPAPLVRDYRPAIEGGTIWVAGNPVTGLISLSRADDAILIENVAVDPDQQGRGLGRRLMEFAEDHARKLQIRRLALYTNEVMTENQEIYAHLGYRVSGRRTEKWLPPRLHGEDSPRGLAGRDHAAGGWSMRTRLPDGSRTAQSLVPHGCSVGSWTTSAPEARTFSKTRSRSSVLKWTP